ncbi:hypothetical protein RKE25_23170 (plasmid) [Dyella sp. BiH032]|uniref:hypothetical protein n=1 Tax=Dyella sp. BiH032 TaxID=3075430 RepID=UPI00289371EC|nr:hypothetical protein [Dyella sp. BiH032]WNL48585.1 hypothetical protein RKE25_23170 [Dyella sp. BiH032]
MKQIQPVKQSTEQDFDFALGVVPPARFNVVAGKDGYAVFAMGEAVSGSLYHWHVAIGQAYWTFLGCITLTEAEVLAHVRAAAAEVAA